jgi:hypothetical protein
MLQHGFRSTGRPLPTANGTDYVERHLQQRIRQCNTALRQRGNLTFNFQFIPEFMKDVLYQYRTRCIQYIVPLTYISFHQYENPVYAVYTRCIINM